MSPIIYDKVIALLLEASSYDRERGQMCSFLYSPNGFPMGQVGVEMFLSASHLTRAALLVRENGPSYLRYLPIGDVTTQLTSFMRDHFGLLAPHVLFKTVTDSFAALVPAETCVRLSTALKESRIFFPIDELTLFPLVPIASATTLFPSDFS